MLKQRILSSLGVWSLLAFVLYAFKTSGVVCLIILLAGIAQIEFSVLLKSDRRQILFDLLLSVCFIVGYVWTAENFYTYVDLVYAIALIFICNRSVFVGKTAKSFLISLFCFWYFSINLHFFLKVLDLYQWRYATGLSVIVWMVLVTKLTDVGGFCIGCWIGQHRLAPAVSPKKTWEGVMGGISFALLGGWFYCIACKAHLPADFSGYKCALFAVIMAWGSIVSDLLESLLKRQLNTKDSGHIIPGIGGVLDLIDSLLLNAPLGYLLLKYFC